MMSMPAGVAAAAEDTGVVAEEGTEVAAAGSSGPGEAKIAARAGLGAAGANAGPDTTEETLAGAEAVEVREIQALVTGGGAGQ